MSTDEVTNTLSTWYEEEGRWRQVLPPMPTGRVYPNIISHDNLLLVTGGVAEDGSTVLNTTDVLDLTTMKWTTPQGLSLPIPLWLHHLSLCGEYLYLIGQAITHKVTESFNAHKTTESEHNAKMHVWRAKWNDVKEAHKPQPAVSPQQTLKQGVWNAMADPPVAHHKLSDSAPGACTNANRQNTSPKDIFTYDDSLNDWTHLGQLSSGRYSHCSVPPKNTVVLAIADGGRGSLAGEFEGTGSGGTCSGAVEMYCSCESM